MYVQTSILISVISICHVGVTNKNHWSHSEITPAVKHRTLASSVTREKTSVRRWSLDFLIFFFPVRVVAVFVYDECGQINGAICLIAAAAATETLPRKEINKDCDDCLIYSEAPCCQVCVYTSDNQPESKVTTYRGVLNEGITSKARFLLPWFDNLAWWGGGG